VGDVKGVVSSTHVPTQQIGKSPRCRGDYTRRMCTVRDSCGIGEPLSFPGNVVVHGSRPSIFVEFCGFTRLWKFRESVGGAEICWVTFVSRWHRFLSEHFVHPFPKSSPKTNQTKLVPFFYFVPFSSYVFPSFRVVQIRAMPNETLSCRNKHGKNGLNRS